MKLREVQIFLVDMALLITGLLCLSAGAFYVLDRELSLAVTALSAGVILLFASTIDRFESFKGWGIEAKTRKLDATLDRAELALTELKELAEMSGAALVFLNSSAGRLGAPTVDASYQLSRRVKGSLTRLNSSPEVVRDALSRAPLSPP
jgi:hypothetical protein